jgi:hypothetical protein
MNRFKLAGWTLLGGVLSLLTGTLPDAIDPQREEARESNRAPVARVTTPTGYGIEGDGFYVWYEDRREAEEWATELAGPAFPKQGS